MQSWSALGMLRNSGSEVEPITASRSVLITFSMPDTAVTPRQVENALATIKEAVSARRMGALKAKPLFGRPPKLDGKNCSGFTAW